MDDPTDSFALETAACLWEAVLNLRDSPVADPESLTLAMSIRSSFDAVGTAGMRMTVIGWTSAVDAAWETVKNSYEMCFDWDFVPDWIVANIDWSNLGHPAIRPAGPEGEGEGNGGGDDAASNPEDPMTYPTTIRTAVGQSIIGKVGRLFNGTATDVLNELLQNARRAGAKRVDIEQLTTERGPVLRVRDDGRGIADPAKFLTLGDSGWDETIARSEDPAGMGVFSLAGRHVIVRSRPANSIDGWQVTIPPDAWGDANPLAVEVATIRQGTEIEIVMPENWIPHLSQVVEMVSIYYPVPVHFDGTAQIRDNFLKGAVFIDEWNGCRIGVFRDNPSLDKLRINFHGLTVPCKLPSVGEVGSGRHWQVRVEIVDAPDLQLVLPARKEMVENPALDQLRDACKTAIFRAIARRGHHRLSFSDWRLARQLGVHLPEASPWLDRWTPCSADDDTYMDGQRIAGEPMVLLPEAPPCIDQSVSRVLARERIQGAAPVREISAFDGYRWYGALPRVVGLSFRVKQNGEIIDYDGSEALTLPVESGLVDLIALEINVRSSADPAAESAMLSLPADLLIALPAGWGDVGEATIFLAPQCMIEPVDLARLLMDACFSPSDDVEMDSYETQREIAETEAQFIATNLLRGEDAALIERVRNAMWAEISWLIPKGRSLTMQAGAGNVEVAFAANDPGPVSAAA